MRYRYVRERENYEDYASGRVFIGAPGNPALPVRLASETLQRCVGVLESMGHRQPYRVYDPCCGAAYHLAVVGYLHMCRIREIIASDIDATALAIARRNLGMLALEGLHERMAELAAMRDAFGKRSHTAALASAARLQLQLTACPPADRPSTRLFLADATDPDALERELDGEALDIVLTDVPYGWRSGWQSGRPEGAGDSEPLWLMLRALRSIVSDSTVLAIAADKSQRIEHGQYERIQRFRAGRRQISVLRPIAGSRFASAPG